MNSYWYSDPWMFHASFIAVFCYSWQGLHVLLFHIAVAKRHITVVRSVTRVDCCIKFFRVADKMYCKEGAFSAIKKLRTTRTTRLRCLSSHAFYDFVDRVVRRDKAPRAPLNQCEHWREVGRSSQTKMTDEPSDVSKVANNTLDVHEQVPGKKRDTARNKRDASVLEKLKTSSVEDIVLDETKTQILSIAGVEYLPLSTKVRLHFCREMGIMVPNKKRKKEEIMELILNHVSGRVLKEIMKQPMKKKSKAAKTRPTALMKDGMLYHIINVICSTAGQPLFLNTKQVMSRATLDSGDKNMSLYEGMADLYEDMMDTI